jgi:hypothetical protein
MEYVWKYIGKRARELSVKPISDEEMEKKGFIVKKTLKVMIFSDLICIFATSL